MSVLSKQMAQTEEQNLCLRRAFNLTYKCILVIVVLNISFIHWFGIPTSHLILIKKKKKKAKFFKLGDPRRSMIISQSNAAGG